MYLTSSRYQQNNIIFQSFWTKVFRSSQLPSNASSRALGRRAWREGCTGTCNKCPFGKNSFGPVTGITLVIHHLPFFLGVRKKKNSINQPTNGEKDIYGNLIRVWESRISRPMAMIMGLSWEYLMNRTSTWTCLKILQTASWAMALSCHNDDNPWQSNPMDLEKYFYRILFVCKITASHKCLRRNIWGFPEMGVPQIDGSYGKIPLKWMITRGPIFQETTIWITYDSWNSYVLFCFRASPWEFYMMSVGSLTTSTILLAHLMVLRSLARWALLWVTIIPNRGWDWCPVLFHITQLLGI